MERLRTLINEKRTIKINSLNSYMIIIKKLFDGTATSAEFENLDFLKNIDNIKQFLTKFKLSTQKNYISGIIVALDASNDTNEYDSPLKQYNNILQDINDKYAETVGEKTETQIANWTSLKSLIGVMNNIKKQIISYGILKKNVLNKTEFNMLQSWVICNLYLNDDNPPVRLDYAPMLILSETEFKKLDKLICNYLVIKSRNVKYFSFNDYKTYGTYGKNDIPLGKKLNSVVNIWLKYNTTGYLLINKYNEPMSSNGLGKEITKIFSELNIKVSCSMLRHIYLSEKYPNVTDEKKNISSKMMHSVGMQLNYSLK
jgi:hypothetical protein